MADLEQVASDLNSASQSLQELREKYDGALDLLDNKNTEITVALESAKSNALQEVQTASDTATSQISQLKDTSLNAVNEAKNTATSEISSKKEEALGEFSQATSEFNSTKEEALSQIEQAKTEQGEKITALEQAKAEQESSITELKESVSTQGEKITALEQAKESITANLNKKSKLLTENLTWTVGSGGDYEDLQTAINEASKYKSISNYKINIFLKSSYIINSTIFFYGDLSFINITAESNSEITVNLSNMSYFYPNEGGMFILINCNSPFFNIKLNLTGTAPSSLAISNIFLVLYGSSFIRPIITITGDNQPVARMFSIREKSNCVTGVLSIQQNNICNIGIYISQCSDCDLFTGTILKGNTNSIDIYGLSRLNLAFDVSNFEGSVSINQGSLVAQLSGQNLSSNIAKNTLTSNGIFMTGVI
ncbi:coiled-coil domain-containing protein [Campylobacter jejuni]